jgi:hypothetical protein
MNASRGILTGAVGLTFVARAETGETEPGRLYVAVVTVDAQLPHESTLRLSSRIDKKGAGIDVAGTVNGGAFTIDAEYLATVKPDSEPSRPSGFYAGIQWNPSTSLSLAVRCDGRSERDFKDFENRFAAGFSYKIKDGIYGAFEIGRRFPHTGAPSNELAIELGLQQKIELPGFQRKTLGRE